MEKEVVGVPGEGFVCCQCVDDEGRRMKKWVQGPECK